MDLGGYQYILNILIFFVFVFLVFNLGEKTFNVYGFQSANSNVSNK